MERIASRSEVELEDEAALLFRPEGLGVSAVAAFEEEEEAAEAHRSISDEWWDLLPYIAAEEEEEDRRSNCLSGDAVRLHTFSASIALFLSGALLLTRKRCCFFPVDG